MKKKELFLIAGLLSCSLVFGKDNEIKGNFEISPKFLDSHTQESKYETGDKVTKETLNVFDPETQYDVKAKIKGELKDIFEYRLDFISTEVEIDNESTFSLTKKEKDFSIKWLSFLEFYDGLPKINRSKLILSQTMGKVSASCSIKVDDAKTLGIDSEMDKDTYIRYTFSKDNYLTLYPFYSKFVFGEDFKVVRDNIENFALRRFDLTRKYFYKEFLTKDTIYDLNMNNSTDDEFKGLTDLNEDGKVSKSDIRINYSKYMADYSGFSSSQTQYPYFEYKTNVNDNLAITIGGSTGLSSSTTKADSKISSSSNNMVVSSLINYKDDTKKANVGILYNSYSKKSQSDESTNLSFVFDALLEYEIPFNDNFKLKYEGEHAYTYDSIERKSDGTRAFLAKDSFLYSDNKLFFKLCDGNRPYLAYKQRNGKFIDENNLSTMVLNGDIKNDSYSPGLGYRKVFDNMYIDISLYLDLIKGEDNKQTITFDKSGISGGFKVKYTFE